MKLGSLREGRDGRLVVVSRDLRRSVFATEVAPTLQAALDNWKAAEPRLRRLADDLERGASNGAFDFDPSAAAAPLPRAYQWLDGSAYVNHVERVRRSRNAEMPPQFWTDPLMYQGGSDDFLGPRDPILALDEDWGIDLEGEVAVITGDVPMGIGADEAGAHILLLMLVNDVSLRNLIPAELAKGFGFVQGKPATAFSPVAVTPDELGEAWDGRRLNLPLLAEINGRSFGTPDAGRDMVFDFPQLISHAAKTRNLGAGTIIGSGTVSNKSDDVGFTCIAEARAVETIRTGKPRTPFLRFGDRLRLDMKDGSGQSVFGTIEQTVARYSGKSG